MREEFVYYPPDFSDSRVCVMFLHGLLCRQGEDCASGRPQGSPLQYSAGIARSSIVGAMACPRPARASILVGVLDIVQLGLEMGKMEVGYGDD
ncbi:MAG: hypothetical protein ACJ8CB_08485 [Ktedonobacteraceae bacterium]